MLKNIETKRSSIGTAANRLESVLALQQSKIANYASSKSTIMDADIAKESSKLISEQILRDAASALLSQSAEVQRTVALSLINGLG